MKKFIIFLFCLAALITHAQQKPNIILIIADDLGYGELGCYGQQKIETPNIDQLTNGGLRFSQFYSGSTVCAPSRVSLMTGLHTGHTVIRGNKGTKPEGQTPLPDSVLTIANVLQQQGYKTAAFGKWGLGFITTSGAPSKKGFDEFFGYNCQTLAHDYYPDHLWNNQQRLDFPGNRSGDSIYSADLIHQRAITFLKTKHDQPFFAFLPYTLPHGDVIAPHDSLYRYYIQKFNEQPLLQRPAHYSNTNRSFEPYPHAAFAAMVSRLDRYVGEVVATLQANGTLKNTLIIFTSDNGPHRENGGDPDYFDGNGIYRGIKRDLYEGGIRVPFIAYWEGTIKSRKEAVTDIAALWDLYPTFQELAGMKVSNGIDGISMLPVLTGKGKRQERPYLYWEFHEQQGRQAILYNGEWKGIREKVNTDANAPIELYNLLKDPGEKNNVAAEFPAIAKQIEKRMKEAHVANKDWPLLPDER